MTVEISKQQHKYYIIFFLIHVCVLLSTKRLNMNMPLL